MKEKKFSRDEIYSIINGLIKEEMKYKNKYIALNGYSSKETLNRFDERIAAFSELYRLFK